MKSATDSSNNTSTYSYDGDGKRTKRNIAGTETWQVYGLGGELIAEYPANGAATSPQKEYGYRNGELLITAAGSSCGVGNTGSRTWLGTDGALGHVTGHAEGTNWAVYAGSDSPTAMVYGPYDTTYGQGHHTAQFKLMVDNNSGSDVIATLDVVTSYGGNVLATRQIRRSDFAAANQWQTFTLQLDNPCFGLFEARVWWAGNASMKFAQLTITPLSVATSGVQWLVTDQLGTPRMVFDKTGWLSGVSRHDYLPFGEELYAGVGGRTAQEGYAGDSVRQHFTGYENDLETGLNFAQARYQSPVQGRFTSVDPLGRSASALNPQSFNRYSYVNNNPVNAVDPSGLALIDVLAAQEQHDAWVKEAIGLKAFNNAFNSGDINAARSILAANPTIGYEMNSSANPNAEGNVTVEAKITGPAGEPQDGQGVPGPGANATPQSATDGPNRSVIMTYSDGTQEVRSGGTRSWRNNNPGNIIPGNFANANGSIGSAGRNPGPFAVFPTEAAGRATIPALLLTPSYQAVTLDGAIALWAPARAGNNTAAYQAYVQNATGIGGNTRMNTLTAAQIQTVADAIRSNEAWRVGTVTYRRPR